MRPQPVSVQDAGCRICLARHRAARPGVLPGGRLPPASPARRSALRRKVMVTAYSSLTAAVCHAPSGLASAPGTVLPKPSAPACRGLSDKIINHRRHMPPSGSPCGRDPAASGSCIHQVPARWQAGSSPQHQVPCISPGRRSARPPVFDVAELPPPDRLLHVGHRHVRSPASLPGQTGA